MHFMLLCTQCFYTAGIPGGSILDYMYQRNVLLTDPNTFLPHHACDVKTDDSDELLTFLTMQALVRIYCTVLLFKFSCSGNLLN